MDSRLDELAELVDGAVVGDGHTPIHAATTLSECGPGHITLIDDGQKSGRLSATKASAAVVPRGLAVDLPSIEVDDVHAAFGKIVQHFHPHLWRGRRGISPEAMVSPTAKLGPNVDVHSGAMIGEGVEIGADSTIYGGARIMAGCRLGRSVRVFPGAVLYEETRVGDRVTIHACAVLGADGFGYRVVEGRHQLCAQLGYVDIADDVDIGAGTTIDRGTYGPTRIGEGTKIDNQVQIGHNCRIGRHNLICSQVGIAGSTSTGDYVVIAGQVGIRDHVHIGSQAMLGAKAGIPNDVAEGASMLGTPATPLREQKLKQAALSKLPEMRRQLKKLTAEVQRIKRGLETIEAADDTASADESAAA